MLRIGSAMPKKKTPTWAKELDLNTYEEFFEPILKTICRKFNLTKRQLAMIQSNYSDWKDLQEQLLEFRFHADYIDLFIKENTGGEKENSNPSSE